MTADASRRSFLTAAVATPLLHVFANGQAIRGQSAPRRKVRVRTITAGVTVTDLDDRAPIEDALGFLERAQRAFEESGYEVQTRRLTLAWLSSASATGARRPTADPSFDRVRALDELAGSRGALLNLGAVNGAVANDRLPAWIAELLRTTKRVSCSVDVADLEHGVREEEVLVAAQAIGAIATTIPQGLGNFRFAAAANIPAGTPFFPVSRHAGTPAFAVGLETAGLVHDAFTDAKDAATARDRLLAVLNGELAHAERTAIQVATVEGRAYLGIDASPAPGMDRSIGRAIEALTRLPFGRASTLTACAVITDALKRLAVKTCGYSGLMLPVLEDPVLAARAREGTYGVQELLLYSSVCGTGLDVVPLAGDTSPERLAALIRDVAALSAKWQKPLSARLLPVPGVRAGDAVHFDDPLLTDCVAMRLD
jgi:uncharacterized protein